MLDVLKRLAELDKANPNVVKEGDQKVDECGMMPEMGVMSMPERPSHPASINMSAGSGEELSDMLTTIMTLAGRGGDMHHDATPMSAPPAAPLEPVGPEPDATSSMRSVIDKLNPMDSDDEGEPEDDAERKPVDEYDNTPEDPNDKSEFDPNQFAHQENQPGQGDRMDGNMPKGIPTMEEVERQLFAEYKKFVREN